MFVNLIPITNSANRSRGLLNKRRLRKVSFTGSTGAGSMLLHQAVDHVLKSSKNLGGNGPFLVPAGTDVDTAVDVVMVSRFRIGWQSIESSEVAPSFSTGPLTQQSLLPPDAGSSQEALWTSRYRII